MNKRFKKALDYPTMPVSDICALDVGRLAAPDSVLWLWVTDRFALEGAGAAVARAWGFEPIRYLVWQKTGIGMGHCPRAAHELCMVCRRGRNIWQRRDVPIVHRWGLVYENGARKHSAKPPAFFDLASTCTPGPYLELFARERRLGWEAWGNEVNSTVTIEANGAAAHRRPEARLRADGLSGEAACSPARCAPETSGESRSPVPRTRAARPGNGEAHVRDRSEAEGT